jgi:hypothetical protein
MKRTLLVTLLLGLVLLGSGCQSFSAFRSEQPSLAMTIDQINPDGKPGEYILYGQTSLPDGTELVISAVRPLTSSDSQVSLSDATIYGTLARTSAIAENSRWQTHLKLWQVSSTGAYQEYWQMQEDLDSLELAPSPDVEFLVTFSPPSLARAKQSDLGNLKQLGESPLFQVTPDGEPYLEARKVQAVPLPNPNMAVTVFPPEAESSPWAGRNTLAPTDTSFDSQPELPFAENDNLPITAGHSLQ